MASDSGAAEGPTALGLSIRPRGRGRSTWYGIHPMIAGWSARSVEVGSTARSIPGRGRSASHRKWRTWWYEW